MNVYEVVYNKQFCGYVIAEDDKTAKEMAVKTFWFDYRKAALIIVNKTNIIMTET